METVAPHAGAWIETCYTKKKSHKHFVAPHAGAWIETLIYNNGKDMLLVAPHAGAWIETCLKTTAVFADAESHPTRVRGLKRAELEYMMRSDAVAPHAGAWIETSESLKYLQNHLVAPHAGAWIETLC